MVEILVFLGLLALGFFVGGQIERKHLADIRARETKTRTVPLVTFGAKQVMPPDIEGQLFVGNVVVSIDYFKMVSATLRNLIGGRVIVYESILDRGRREAALRMKEQAIAWGATQVANVRLETSNVGSQTADGGIVALEVTAYGTGLRQRRSVGALQR